VGKKWVSGDCSYLCKGLISEKLKEYWSPEQIMGRLELDKKIKISTETAYRFVLQDKAVGGALYKYLRHQHKKYRKRYGKNDYRGRDLFRTPIFF
jgi:IS30 family transposase